MKWFTDVEFRRVDLLRADMKVMLDELRERIGVPIIITSSYRDPEHNARVGGALNSSHIPAADGLYSGIDFTFAGGLITSQALFKVLPYLYDLGFKRIGLYKDMKHIHIDLEQHLPQEVVWIK